MATSAVDIVIPVYNEHENIGTALRRIVNEVKIPFKISLVYDNDTDTTLPAAAAAAGELRIEVALIKNRFGKGALNAIKTGLLYTTGEYVVVTMADLSDPPAVINAMYEAAENLPADVVCGSRYMRGGSQEEGTAMKAILSRTAGLTLHYFAGIPTHDSTNSFKLYRRKVLQNIEIESQGGFELGLEIVVKAHALGFRVAEVPTQWSARLAGESRFRLLEWMPSYLRWYFFAFASRLKLVHARAKPNTYGA